MINANRVFQLNATAAAMMYLALNEIPQDQAARKLNQQFNAPKSAIAADYASIKKPADGFDQQ